MDCDTSGGLGHLLQRYSDWNRLKRAVVILLRLKAILRKKPVKRLSEPITVDDIRAAEVAILQHVQGACFGSIPAKASHIASLKPFKDDRTNLLRVGGGLVNVPISYDAKHPVILPRNHYVTTLIIKRCHLCLGHSGTVRVLTEIRQYSWITKDRYTINSLLKSCMVCRRMKATPQNQHICKLVQLTDSFINALQRLIARRGKSSEIKSDNGSNFVGGLRELRQAVGEWNQQRISNHLLQSNIKCVFNPPGASHIGGGVFGRGRYGLFDLC